MGLADGMQGTMSALSFMKVVYVSLHSSGYLSPPGSWRPVSLGFCDIGLGKGQSVVTVQTVLRDFFVFARGIELVPLSFSKKDQVQMTGNDLESKINFAQ